MKYQLAVFDMDGTILDTLTDLHNSINHCLHEYGYPEHTIHETRFFVGNGIRNLVKNAMPEGAPEAEIDRVLVAFMDYYREHSKDETKPYKGITELLGRLHAAGMKTAVVSNKADEAVLDLCKVFYNGLFDFATGEREGVARKPEPDLVNLAFDALHISKDHAIYIGDSDVDIMTAKKSDLPCICVTWGFRDEEFLRGYGATVFANTPEELGDLLLVD